MKNWKIIHWDSKRKCARLIGAVRAETSPRAWLTGVERYKIPPIEHRHTHAVTLSDWNKFYAPGKRFGCKEE